MAEQFTVFGAGGFLGSRLVGKLRAEGAEVRAVTRDSWPAHGAHLGHGIYSIGVTGDFRSRAHDAMEAHVGALSRALASYTFDSFIYMSSTRLYRCAEGAAKEDAHFTLMPGDTDKLYDISKMAGEALCHAAPRQRTHVVRMSNAYAPGDTSPNFLPSVLREAATTGTVTIRQSPASRKDYIALDDAADGIIAISRRGTADIYNVASGMLTTHHQIADTLERIAGWRVRFADGGADDLQPQLDVSRLANFIPWSPRRVLDDLPAMIDAARKAAGA
jgi:nucleoside-diphosphate-sugar epimerase